MYLSQGIYSLNRRKKHDKKSEVIFWLLFIITMSFKGILFQYKYGVSTYSLPGIVLSVLGLAAIPWLVSNRRRYYIALLLNLAFTVILISDLIYSRYYLNPLTASLIYQMRLIGDTQESIMFLFNYKDLMLFIDFFILLIYFITMGMKYGTLAKKISLRLRIGITVALIIPSVISCKIHIPYEKDTLDSFSADSIINQSGIYNFHFSDIFSFIKNNLHIKPLTDTEKEILISRFERNKLENEYTSIAKGMNLMVIQLEAMQGFLIGSTVNGKEITPNLNKLAANSLYFNNVYDQVSGGNTSDAEFITNTSLYPARKGAAYFVYSDNKYHSLPSLLKTNGYNTYAFHANNPSYWNRNVIYDAFKFDKFYSENDFVHSEIIGWGLSDYEFYNQSIDYLTDSEPFYAFMVSLSSHHPYLSFEDYKFDTGKYEGTKLGNYFKAAHYADSAIGALYKKLEDTGMIKNTVLAIYGDHFGITMQNTDKLLDFMGLDNSIPEKIKSQKVPFIIHSPSLNLKGQVETISGQIDIMPTLANIMGIEAPFALGRDILSVDDEDAYVLLRDGSVITDTFIYFSMNNKLYDAKNNNEIDLKNYMTTIAEIQKELSLSDMILDNDIFRSSIFD